MKKSKEVEVNLYNFNAHDEEKKEKNKRKSNTKSKNLKKKNNTKSKNENTKFDFNNEIIIGLPKESVNTQKNKKDVKKKTNNTKKHKRKSQKDTPKKTKKIKKPISEEKQEKIRKKRKRNLKIIKYTFLLLCIIAALVITATSPLFDIKKITVEGNNKITSEEIISLSQININENTYKTNMYKAEQKMLENPYIRSVKIQRKLPSEVLITVKERKATYMIEYGSGYVYINNQGYILEISSEKIDVPIIQGAETGAEEFIPGNRLYTEDLEKMSVVIRIMEVASNNDIANLITRIDIENEQNYKILFESEEKVAYIGDGTDLSTKILSIKSILEKEKGIAGEIFVDMDLKNNYPTFRQNV